MTDNLTEGLHGSEGPWATEDASHTLALADEMFRETVEDLVRTRAQMREGSGDGVRDAVKLVRELRVATQLVIEERNKLDRLRKDVAGEIGTGRLDLDAARNEIGRRLACLRRATGD